MNKLEIAIQKKNAVIVETHNKTILATTKEAIVKVLSINDAIQQLGFTLGAEALNELIKCDDIYLTNFKIRLETVLRAATGAHRVWNPMYPNFPKQVMEASAYQLHVNAFRHYWTIAYSDATGYNISWLPTYRKEPRLKFDETHSFTVLGLIDETEFREIFTNLVGANGSLSTADKRLMADFVETYAAQIQYMVPSSIPNKENLTFFIGELLKRGVQPVALKNLIKHPTDVLRLAVAMSDGDVSLSEKIKFRKFNRAQRRFILALLENNADIETMNKHKQLWINLGEILHPGEYAKQFPKTFVAFKVLRSGKNVRTHASHVEMKLAEYDVCEAARLLKSRPGEFARRLDKLIRDAAYAHEVDTIISLFDGVVNEVSTPVLLQVLQHFSTRNTDIGLKAVAHNKKYYYEPVKKETPIKTLDDAKKALEAAAKLTQHTWGQATKKEKTAEQNTIDVPGRVVMPKALTTKMYVVPKPYRNVCNDDCNKIVVTVTMELIRRFSSQQPLGKVWINPELYTYNIPFSERTASRALKTITRGSRVKFDECDANKNVVRFFIWWRENGQRADLDLSAAELSDEFSLNGYISFYNLRNGAGCHSGDITSAPNGACEFIDINLTMVNPNTRYILMNVRSFTGLPYTELAEAFGGFMLREKCGHQGEIFDARTVKQKFDITADSTNSIPFLIDVKTREVIWCDLSFKDAYTGAHNFGGRTLHNSEANQPEILRAIATMKKVSIGQLLEMHATARGTVVKNKEDAEKVFDLDMRHEINDILTNYMK